MNIYTLPLGELGANCHIIETNRKNAIAIDIGGTPERLTDFLAEKGLTLKKILLTHGHFDHISGVAAMQEKTGADVFIHTDDLSMLTDPVTSLSSVGTLPFCPVANAAALSEGDMITLDDCRLTVLHTPGHTAGGVCYLGADCLFTGDTLFRGAVGRTDFPTGSTKTLRASLRRLRDLTGDYTIYPGHEAGSTLAHERLTNPYLGADK